MDPIGVERRAQGASGIARRGWDVEIVESGFAQDSRVGDAVQGDAAAEAEILEAGLALQPAGKVDEDLLQYPLHARGDIGVAPAIRRRRVDALPGMARRSQLGDELARPALPGALVEVEVREIERDPAVRSAAHDAPEQLLVRRSAVRGEAHHLVLALVHREAEVGGERRVEHPERVRKAQLARDLQSRLSPAVDFTLAEGQRRPLADAVGGEDGGSLHRSGEERSRGMGLMVLAEQDPFRSDAEPRGDDPLDPEFAAQRVLHRARKAAPGAREPAQGHRQDPIELEHRLFVEDHCIELLGLDARLLEAPFDGAEREPGVVLAAREALFLHRADRHAVDQHRGRRVVVVRGDAEDAHQYWLFMGVGRRAAAKPCGSDRAARLASTANGGRRRKYCNTRKR